LSGEKVDIVNTKESVLPVCNTPYHTNTRIVQKGEEIVVVRNYAQAVFATIRCSTPT